MNQQQQYPGWFLWAWEKGPMLFFGLGTLLFAAICLVAMYVDSRLDKIEDRLVSIPPRSYEPIDLGSYRAKDISIDDLTIRQTVYVPAYSHIYFEGGAPWSLETTLSIRNVDLDQPLYIQSVEYFNTKGELVKTFVDELIEISPLETIEFLVERRDGSGGSGANFLVQWMSANPIDKPLIETVMVGAAASKSLSFGRVGIDVVAPTNTRQ